MPSYISSMHPDSIHRSSFQYDHTLQLLGPSFTTLVAISEEQDDDDCDSCSNSFSTLSIHSSNTKLRRNSFGNQSCRTGLSQLVHSEHDQDRTVIINDSPTRTLLDRYHRYPTPTSPPSHYDRHTATANMTTGWGYFIDE